MALVVSYQVRSSGLSALSIVRAPDATTCAGAADSNRGIGVRQLVLKKPCVQIRDLDDGQFVHFLVPMSDRHDFSAARRPSRESKDHCAKAHPLAIVVLDRVFH